MTSKASAIAAQHVQEIAAELIRAFCNQGLPGGEGGFLIAVEEGSVGEMGFILNGDRRQGWVTDGPNLSAIAEDLWLEMNQEWSVCAVWFNIETKQFRIDFFAPEDAEKWDLFELDYDFAIEQLKAMRPQ